MQERKEINILRLDSFAKEKQKFCPNEMLKCAGKGKWPGSLSGELGLFEPACN